MYVLCTYECNAVMNSKCIVIYKAKKQAYKTSKLSSAQKLVKV